MPSVLRRIPADLRLLLLFLALIAPARVLQTAHIRWMSVDGGYYTDVAKNVRDGHGLASNMSLYNFGYEYFPHPTSVYPLWPILLGLTARVVDVVVAAHWLPLLLSFVAVIAAFGFGRRLWPEPLFPERVPDLHAGHVFAAVVALNAEFVTSTSLPYTEGLAWALMMLFAWRTTARNGDLGLRWAIELGVWLGALYLARFQFLIAPLALACAVVARLIVGPDRGRVLAHGAVALGVASLFIGGWFLRVRRFVHDPGLSTLLRFDQNRANDRLPPLDVIVEDHGLLDVVLDRAGSVLVAWSPSSDASYHGSFHTLHWALIAALPLLAVTLWRDRANLLAKLRRPESAHWFFLIALAAGGLLAVHLVHKQFAGPWYFAKRQGLTSLFAFLLSLGWLLRQPRPVPTVLGVLILSSTVVLGANTLWREATQVGGELREADRHGALVSWLQSRADAEDGVVVAMDAYLLQRIGWRTDEVYYHWVAGRTSFDELLTMSDALGARYVVFRKQARSGFRIFIDDKCRLDREYVKLAEEPSGVLIYRRSPADPDLPPCPPTRRSAPVEETEEY